MGFISGLFVAAQSQAQDIAKDAQIIDVRTTAEFSEGHIQGAAHIDVLQTAAFEAAIQKLDKSKHYLVYCRSGGRSGQAQAIMKARGFKHVENLGSKEQAQRKLGL